jgi:hypothetical protein
VSWPSVAIGRDLTGFEGPETHSESGSRNPGPATSDQRSDGGKCKDGNQFEEPSGYSGFGREQKGESSRVCDADATHPGGLQV